MLSHLNKKQKILLVAAILFFAVGNAYLFYISIPRIDTSNFDSIRELFAQKQIKVYVKKSITDNEFEEELIFGKDEDIDIDITSGIVVADLGENNIMIAEAPVEFSVGEALDVKEGLVYIESNSGLNLLVNAEVVSLNSSVKGVFDSFDKQFIVFDGEVDVNNEKATINDFLTLDKEEFKINKFDRSKLTSNLDWRNLISILSELDNIPASLADLDGPEIVISPKDEFSTKESAITISGTIEPKSILKMNNTKILVELDGSFETEFELDPGENSITFEAVDQFGNKSVKVVTYYNELSEVVEKSEETEEETVDDVVLEF